MVTLKRCSKCRIEKSLAKFSPDPRKKHGRTNNCKSCAAAYKRRRQEEDPEYYRRGNVRTKYGLSLDEYAALMAQPCAICGAESQHLDHDHASGKNRKALCRHCNFMLGHCRDDAAVLRNAANYLEEHNAS